MKTNLEKLTAELEGMKAAVKGRKLDANTYAETDDLHFVWLAAYAETRMVMIQQPKSKDATNES